MWRAARNIGAGTITCNYDGFDKHRTEIGAGAFIGSNTALVAPVKVGDGAFIGAGSDDHRGRAAPTRWPWRARRRSIKPGRAAEMRARRASKAGKRRGRKS